MMASSVIVPNTVMTIEYYVYILYDIGITADQLLTDNNNLFFDEDIQEKMFIGPTVNKKLNN